MNTVTLRSGGDSRRILGETSPPTTTPPFFIFWCVNILELVVTHDKTCRQWALLCVFFSPLVAFDVHFKSPFMNISSVAAVIDTHSAALCEATDRAHSFVSCTSLFNFLCGSWCPHDCIRQKDGEQGFPAGLCVALTTHHQGFQLFIQLVLLAVPSPGRTSCNIKDPAFLEGMRVARHRLWSYLV